MAAPYTITLDQESARELEQRGATLLFLDMPEGCALGIDQQTFLVGPKFQGVKMVPPGLHVISYSSTSGQGDFGPVTSFFLFAKSGQVVVRRWNPLQEVLQELPDEDEVERYAQGVRSFQFDSGLAPYDLRRLNAWRQLSNYVTADVIDAHQPLSGNINVLAEADPAAFRPATAAEEALSQQLAAGRAAQQAAQQAQQAQQQQGEGQGMEEQKGKEGEGALPMEAEDGAAEPADPESGPASHAGRCYYTPLPRLVKRAGLTPAELTSLNMDKSPLLEELLQSKYKGSEDALLGEFQFCFLAFLLGQSLEGFSQWRAFLQLMLGCEAAPLGPRAGLYVRFLQALHAQLKQSLMGGVSSSSSGEQQRGGSGSAPPRQPAPGVRLREEQASVLGTPLVDELLGDSFLRRLATGFFRMLSEERCHVSGELAQQAQRVTGLLAAALGWGVSVVTELGGEGEDEEGPVIVEEGAPGF